MNNIIYPIFKCSIFLLFLQSMLPWFLWGMPFQVTILITIIFSVIFTLSSLELFSLNKSSLVPVLFLTIIQLYAVKDLNANGFIVAMLHIAIISIVLLLKDQIKINLLQFFTTAYSTILLISLFVWMLFFIGIPLPSYSTDYNDGQYFYYNYYFFLLNYVDTNLPIPRFSSVFLEPGHLGMISSFLLYANKFDLKLKKNWVILVATLVTFSLAAYVLLLFSVFTFVLLKSKKPVINLLLLIGFLFVLYSYFSTLDNGNNLVNNLIIERLQFRDGDIEGNNRFSPDLEIYFEQFMKTNDSIFGLGTEKYSKMSWQGGSAGYKVFILQYGIVGTVLLFLFYFTMVIYKMSKFSLMFLMVYIFSFLQRAYALWDVELLIFITALPVFTSNFNNKINDK